MIKDFTEHILYTIPIMLSQAKKNSNPNCYHQGTHSLRAETHAKMSVICASAGCDGHTDGSAANNVNAMPGYPGRPSLKLTVGIKTNRKTSWILNTAT